LSFGVQGSLPRKAVDVGLGIAIPVHSHIALNAVISDYVPKSVRGTPSFQLCASNLSFHLMCPYTD
jgi:hypothetical protein